MEAEGNRSRRSSRFKVNIGLPNIKLTFEVYKRKKTARNGLEFSIEDR